MSERLESLLDDERRAECERNDPPAKLRMRTLVLYGHQQTTSAVFMQVSDLQRQRRERDVALIYAANIERPLAQGLRTAGAVLWYCGPDLTPRDGEGCPDQADRHLLATTWSALAEKVANAFAEFTAGGLPA